VKKMRNWRETVSGCPAALSVALLAILAGLTCQSAKRPSVPVVSGPDAGVAGMPLTFKATSEDPDGDSVAFMFDWGDTTTKVWTDFVQSGETISVNHTFADSGRYSVRARVKNTGNQTGDWSSQLEVRVLDAGLGYPDSLIGNLWAPNPWKSTFMSIVVSRDGKHLYISSLNDSSVYAMRTNDGVPADTVLVGYTPRGMCLSPDGRYLYVAVCGESVVAVIRTEDNQLVDRVPVGGEPRNVAITPDGEHVYVVVPDPDSVIVFRTSDDSMVARLRIGSSPYAVRVAPDGGSAWVTTSGNSVKVINTATNTLSGQVRLRHCGIGIAFSSDSQAAYVGEGEDTIAVISTASESVMGRIHSPSFALDIEVTPDGRFATVACDAPGGAPVLDLADYLLIGYLETGMPAASAVAISPDGNRAYVAVMSSGIYAFSRRGFRACSPESDPLPKPGRCAGSNPNPQLSSPLGQR
jgi:YVTN family beta-propeller protein